MKFKTKIVFASCTILLFALSALSINQYLTAKNNIHQLTENSVTEFASSIASSLEDTMATKAKMARYAMDLIEDDLSEDSIERVISKNSLKEFFVLIGVGFESDGSLIDNDINWQPVDNYDSRTRPWYQEAKRKESVIFTEPYPDSVTNEILVSIGVPMKQNGSFIGAMFLDVSLKELSASINSINLLNSGYAFLLTRDNKFITHPDDALHGKLANQLFGNQVDFSGRNKMTEVDGVETQLSFYELPSLGWKLGIALDVNKLNATEYELRNNAIIYSGIAVLIAIFALTMLINRLMAPLKDINDAMEDIASGDGDLTQTMNTNTDEEFAQLAKSFNGFCTKLGAMIFEVKTLGKSISEGTHQTAEGAVKSSQAMEQQLQELEQLATAMNEMATTSTEVARNAQGASGAVQEARDSVDEGVNTVSRTATAIEELSGQIDHAVEVVQEVSKATNNIESILAVINDIADQTNLLALNAAIEAARAGEQGRGFAVVADEVRTLASRTQQSTSEIREMIDQLAAGSRSAVEVMGQSKEVATSTVEISSVSSQALERIRDAITRITDMNMQIASAAEEQSLVAEDINKGTLNIKELSEEVSQAAQHASVNTQEQSDMVTKQDALLNQFKV
ncbi:methyl-accepting chemotaxis protein [Ferrimonas aestuarii]|uniref:Methyl-accepting chemotaxis protein n=1 Tax=Ferrimonas aestuarii TaxID=2569539 RepID=A0A4U1BVC5_9GAMM|nr:methyl-accepting chemotaxis protein [Ferrimonas aestuarii]TKB56771.1 methyl-accepting chemotaxis protein [Ferrimonas aestuarii]